MGELLKRSFRPEFLNRVDDIVLFKPLSLEEIKSIVKLLLERLKTLLVLNWRQKAAARSVLKLAIEDTLADNLPSAYTMELCAQKSSAIFEHVFESYPEKTPGCLRKRCERH